MSDWLKILKDYIDTLESAIGNPTGDMSAVSLAEDASLAAYVIYAREMARGHNQTRLCLIVPDLANLASDAPNTAIKTELEKIATVTVLDETGVDDGQEDWDFYDAIVVGSNTYAAFTNANLDDLILLKVPVMVCNRDVAMHLLLGDTQTQSASDVNEYCESIHNRVMYLVFGSLGEKAIFSEATVSDRLDMSDAQLTEQVLMVSVTADGNTKVVVGWLPQDLGNGTVNQLSDGTDMPACRLFAGCFVNADKLTDLGTELLRSMTRNFAQAGISASLTLKAAAAQVAAILNDTADMQPRVVTIETDTDPLVMGRSQIFEKSITSASNAGDVTIATITDQPCLIESVVIHADAAQTGDLTSCGVFGGAGKAITFIAAADALQADLDAENKQVYWEGKVRLPATKTIVISLVGSNGTAVDLTITVKYRACVSGGYLV